MFLKLRFSVRLSFFLLSKVLVFLYPRDQAHLCWGQIGVKDYDKIKQSHAFAKFDYYAAIRLINTLHQDISIRRTVRIYRRY